VIGEVCFPARNTMWKRESYLPSAERVQARVAALYSRAMGDNAMSQSHSPLENLKTTFGVSLDSSGRPDFTAAAHRGCREVILRQRSGRCIRVYEASR
jgi:hypothetical protein